MTTTPDSIRPSPRRWLATLPAILLSLLGLAVFFGLPITFHTRFETIGSALLGVVTAACLLGGVYLFYSAAVDAINLRVIRRSRRAGVPVLRDGAVVAFDGVAEVEGEPLVAPFRRVPCAAYTYEVTHPGRRTGRSHHNSFKVAEGFHLLPTRIRGDSTTLHLGSLPCFQDDLVEHADGKRWGSQVLELIESLQGRAGSASDGTRFARRLALERGDVDEVHEDYLMAGPGNVVEVLQINEAVLPAEERVCVVGTYDEPGARLTARRSWFAPGLTVYRGGADEVLCRIGRDAAFFFRFAPLLVLTGLSLLLLAWVPPELIPQALRDASSDATGPGDLSNKVIWGLAIVIPFFLLWLANHWYGGSAPRRGVRQAALAPEQPAVVLPSTPAAVTSAGSRRVRITHPMLLAAAKKLARQGGPRAQWVQFDGVDWHFNVDHLDDPGEREKAHDILTRFLAGPAVTTDETLWIVGLLGGNRRAR